MATARGKCLAVSVKDLETVEKVKRKYAEHTGSSVEELFITFCGEELENGQPLCRYGILSGDLYLVSLGRKETVIAERASRKQTLGRLESALLTKSINETDGRVVAITVSSAQKPKYPDVTFKTIRLSCESNCYSPKERDYAGFILYAWIDEDGRVLDDWWLNGKHCKSAYMVIQPPLLWSSLGCWRTFY